MEDVPLMMGGAGRFSWSMILFRKPVSTPDQGAGFSGPCSIGPASSLGLMLRFGIAQDETDRPAAQ